MCLPPQLIFFFLYQKHLALRLAPLQDELCTVWALLGGVCEDIIIGEVIGSSCPAFLGWAQLGPGLGYRMLWFCQGLDLWFGEASPSLGLSEIYSKALAKE